MSGVMIKTGIYGLLRLLTLLGPPPFWWGYLLLGIGLSSGVLGVLFALAQHDLKRLLAYHSVENIGIIALGLGAGLLGLSAGIPLLAFLGFAGALLHVLNHALFKSLLFLGAGSVLQATGSNEIDCQGGLLKRLPWTGAFFIAGSLAISGLPPLNGFVSEFLIYLGALTGGLLPGAAPAGPLLLAVAGLALIGGLAAACFTKVCGVVFLGEPRSPQAAQAHEAGPAMRWTMGLLAVFCVLIGLAGPLALRGAAPAAVVAAGLPPWVWQAGLRAAARPLTGVSLAAAVLLLLVLALALIRRNRLIRQGRTVGVTWDCGYTAPTPRMQYTASSFAQPLLGSFGMLLQTRRRGALPQGLFPSAAALHTHTPELFRRRVFGPLFRTVRRNLARLRWLQHGRVQLYVLYIAAALLALLAWKM
jgi:hydrogenase-4 component B